MPHPQQSRRRLIACRARPLAIFHVSVQIAGSLPIKPATFTRRHALDGRTPRLGFRMCRERREKWQAAWRGMRLGVDAMCWGWAYSFFDGFQTVVEFVNSRQ